MFRNLPCPAAIILPDSAGFEVSVVNDSYLDQIHGDRSIPDRLQAAELFSLLHERLPETCRVQFNASLQKVVRTGNSDTLTCSCEVMPGEAGFLTHYTCWKVEHVPIHDDTGRVAFILQTLSDISPRTKSDRELELLESAITHTREGVVIVEAKPTVYADRRIIYVNDAYCETTGYSRDEVIGKPADLLQGEETDKEELGRLLSEMKAWRPAKAELLYYKKSGEKFWMHISVVPVTDNTGNYTHWVSIERDVTERRMQQQRIRESLGEKDILLSEVHHRVKNNLAVISGMLQLQAEEETDRRLRLKLMDSVSRIKTISNVHEHIYKTDNFVRINFAESLRFLTENLVDMFEPEADIRLKYDCDPVYLNVNQAIPCSLIVNEVATNTIKHAFPGRHEGELSLSLANDNGEIRVSIKDDGIGLPDDFCMHRNGSLGMHIIRTLSRQIKGTCRLESAESGCHFTLRFHAVNGSPASGGLGRK
ncbi:histidine kinase dimerization/phosphoacceptor domain -containing protein [Balneolales bacterium ANBcel1]|nr:histidine kinase dimerization/phosphoacceptor domain -containing protein [Balneolales bacterium ANBcel1]